MAVIAAPTNPTHDLAGTHFTSLATPSRGSSETSVWRVTIEPGVVSTPHRLTREEVFVVLGGTAQVTLDGAESIAHAGDAIVVVENVELTVNGDTSSGWFKVVSAQPAG